MEACDDAMIIHSIRISVLFTIALLLPSEVFAYNRQDAHDYAVGWVNTIFGRSDYRTAPYNNSNVDHVNNVQPDTLHGGTGDRDYAWAYAQTFKFRGYPLFHYRRKTNDGDGTVRTGDGEDCTNFVSQVLIAGGIQFPPIDSNDTSRGRGGTITVVKKLDAALRSISTVTEVPTLNALPLNLQVGDVIEFGGHHMTVVVSAPPDTLTVAYHSHDDFGEPPAFLFNMQEKKTANSLIVLQLPSRLPAIS